MILDACGAYGRSYCKADYLAGKDMKVLGGPYFSIRDEIRLSLDGYTHIRFSYTKDGELHNTLYTLP